MYACTYKSKSSGFGNIAVGAMDGVVAGIKVPASALADCIPLCFCALIVDTYQTGAPRERPIAYVCDLVWNCDIFQASASVKRPIAYTLDAVWNRYACQIGATGERLPAYARHTTVSWNSAIFTTQYYGFTCSFYQTASGAVVYCVSGSNRDAC